MKTKSVKSESLLMRFFLKLKMRGVAWSLRRLYCPVSKEELVLEIGSGGAPYHRSNVLCDAYGETQERFYAPLIVDRPMVLGVGENLPFRDNAFDFVIASHVLEHSIEPEKFISEMQRVAKAGYIEVPDAFMERLTHYGFHRLEITDVKNVLVITKKKGYIHDPDVVELFGNKVRPVMPYLFKKFPFHFHVRYYWEKSKGGIQYKITNPEYIFDWEPPQVAPEQLIDTNNIRIKIKNKIYLYILTFLRSILSQNSRNRKIKLESLLMCPACKSITVQHRDGKCICSQCAHEFRIISAK